MSPMTRKTISKRNENENFHSLGNVSVLHSCLFRVYSIAMFDLQSSITHFLFVPSLHSEPPEKRALGNNVECLLNLIQDKAGLLQGWDFRVHWHFPGKSLTKIYIFPDLKKFKLHSPTATAAAPRRGSSKQTIFWYRSVRVKKAREASWFEIHWHAEEFHWHFPDKFNFPDIFMTFPDL